MEHKKTSVELTAVEWNAVISVLVQGTYAVVAPLIEQIRGQVIAQLNSAEQAPTE